MPGWSSAPGHRRRPVLSRSRLRAVAAVTAGAMCLVVCAPVAAAAPAAAGRNVPPVKMYGYAKGPAEREGSAAGRGHYVPASATQAGTGTGHQKGHQAPVPDLAPPPVGSRTLVTTGSATMAPGHAVTGQESGDTGSAQPSAPPSPSDSSPLRVSSRPARRPRRARPRPRVPPRPRRRR